MNKTQDGKESFEPKLIVDYNGLTIGIQPKQFIFHQDPKDNLFTKTLNEDLLNKFKSIQKNSRNLNFKSINFPNTYIDKFK